MQQQMQARMGCTMLRGTGKKGVIRPDSDGWYAVSVGAYGAHNSAGFYYDLPSAAEFFKQGSTLMRKLTKGVLKGEYQHPKRTADMSDQAFIARIRDIDGDRVSHHIKDVWLGDPIRDEEGRTVTPVYAKVKPAGPYGRYLKEALEDPDQNLYFSVRSLTADDMMRQIKYTRDIVTWDFVMEGGIYVASKYHAPSLEDFTDDSVEVTPTLLWGMEEQQKRRRSLGLESDDVDYGAIASSLGWNKESPVQPVRPAYLDW